MGRDENINVTWVVISLVMCFLGVEAEMGEGYIDKEREKGWGLGSSCGQRW